MTKQKQDRKAEMGIGSSADPLRQVAIPAHIIKAGSLRGRVPVVIDSRTIVYIKPRQDADEVRRRYSDHMRLHLMAPVVVEETEDQ